MQLAGTVFHVSEKVKDFFLFSTKTRYFQEERVVGSNRFSRESTVKEFHKAAQLRNANNT